MSLYVVVVYVVEVADTGGHVIIAQASFVLHVELGFCRFINPRSLTYSPDMSVMFTYRNSELTVVYELCRSSMTLKILSVVGLNDRMSFCFYFTGGLVYPLPV